MLATKIPEFLYELAQAIEKSNSDFEEYRVKEEAAFHALVDKYLV